MLFDTDVLVWLLRANKAAIDLVDKIEPRAISIVTYMEVLAGVRNTREVLSLKRLLAEFGFDLLPLSENIGYRASIYMEEYGQGSGLSVPDALIAATAVEHGLALSTANQKHYRPINDLELRIFRP